MAWYPGAIRREIPPGSNDPRIIPVGCILHVAVSGADSLYPYFSGPSGGIESTWYIRYDGTIEQYRDSDYEADANGDGNSWVSGGKRYGLHSVETAGFEHGEWTDAQIESIKKLLVWDAREHGWPLQVIPRWNGKGVGYHVMFGAPGPYTNVRGKTCPGPDRVRQFNNIIKPWLNAGADLEDDMVGQIEAPNGEDWNVEHAMSWMMSRLHDLAPWGEYVTTPSGDKQWSLPHAITWLMSREKEQRNQLPQILANQQALMAAQGVEVDEQALAQQISAVLVPAVVAEVSDATEDELEAAITRVVERLRVTVD